MEHSCVILENEALSPEEGQVASRGRDSQRPASARTTNWRVLNGPGFGLPV
jgi:hypothetical protein